MPFCVVREWLLAKSEGEARVELILPILIVSDGHEIIGDDPVTYLDWVELRFTRKGASNHFRGDGDASHPKDASIVLNANVKGTGSSIGAYVVVDSAGLGGPVVEGDGGGLAVFADLSRLLAEEVAGAVEAHIVVAGRTDGRVAGRVARTGELVVHVEVAGRGDLLGEVHDHGGLERFRLLAVGAAVGIVVIRAISARIGGSIGSAPQQEQGHGGEDRKCESLHFYLTCLPA